jgi:hypothetical protein
MMQEDVVVHALHRDARALQLLAELLLLIVHVRAHRAAREHADAGADRGAAPAVLLVGDRADRRARRGADRAADRRLADLLLARERIGRAARQHGERDEGREHLRIELCMIVSAPGS